MYSNREHFKKVCLIREGGVHHEGWDTQEYDSAVINLLRGAKYEEIISFNLLNFDECEFIRMQHRE